MPNPFPKFDPESIEVALLALLRTANFSFLTVTRAPTVPENVDSANQPYLGLIGVGGAQMEQQAQGLEKWILDYQVIVYVRADDLPSATGATKINAAWKALVEVLRTPTFERNTLGGLVDNVWVEGQTWKDNGNLDNQCALLIPVRVSVGV
jgi:hypothetical protein